MEDYPELTLKENKLIRRARKLGFTLYYPAYPDAKTQAINTLCAAEAFLAPQEDQTYNRQCASINENPYE